MADQRAANVPLSTAKPKRRSRERTSFTSHQKAELEALFSLTQFPDYVTQELLASKIHLQYTVVQGASVNNLTPVLDTFCVFTLRNRPIDTGDKRRLRMARINFRNLCPLSSPQVWFKNRRVKWRKSIQKEQEAGIPAPTPAAQRNRPRAPRRLSHRRPVLPRVSDGSGPGTGNPDGASPQGDPELDRLVATVPALYSAPYDISQVMEAYGCLEESSNTFSCLYQYLSLSDG
ncbi:arginine-fifty homeobox-like [Panthera uncia]|uniref:arginine-fifty homeobox-like n=1 Tax=Panthera uncia TaxID=29064 RepID=UPI0020FFB774|nr:arginine-fifty homeobox-like [Panthera uncia]